MLVPGDKQVSPAAVVERKDLAGQSCLAGERQRSIDVRTHFLLLKLG
jgi:hypothetical protein